MEKNARENSVASFPYLFRRKRMAEKFHRARFHMNSTSWSKVRAWSHTVQMKAATKEINLFNTYTSRSMVRLLTCNIPGGEERGVDLIKPLCNLGGGHGSPKELHAMYQLYNLRNMIEFERAADWHCHVIMTGRSDLSFPSMHDTGCEKASTQS